MLSQPLEDTFSVSASVVFDGFSSLVFAPELEGGETLNVNTGNFVFGGVDLSEDDVGVVGQSFGSFIVVRSQCFAVSAPGSIEFNENFLIVVHDKFFPLFSDNDLNGLVVGFGDGSGFEVGFNFTGADSFGEGFKVIDGDFIVVVAVLQGFAVEVDQLGSVADVNSHVFS